MNDKLKEDICDSMIYFFEKSKNQKNLLQHTAPWTNSNHLKTLSLRAILEIFSDYKASELIDYYESIAYCQRLIELSAMNDEDNEEEDDE
jgi:hypothetical protein